jgi:hypothetical protein
MTSTRNIETEFLWLDVVVLIIGALSCIALLYVIVKKNIWNDFNRIITYIMISELLFFSSHVKDMLVLAHADGVGADSVAPKVLAIMGQLGSVVSYLFSALLSFCVTYLLQYKKIFGLKKNMYTITAFFILINATWLPLSIYGTAKSAGSDGNDDDAEKLNSGDKIYLLSLQIVYGLKIAIIAFNIIFYPINVYLLNKMFGELTIRVSNISKGSFTSLINRLKFYPILEAVTLIFPVWMTVAFPDYRAKNVFHFDNSYFLVLYAIQSIFRLIVPVGYLFLYCRISSIVIKCCGKVDVEGGGKKRHIFSVKTRNEDDSKPTKTNNNITENILNRDYYSSENINAQSDDGSNDNNVVDDLTFENLDDDKLERAIEESTGVVRTASDDRF